MHSTLLRLYGVATESIVDGPGLRYAIFTQGCPHGCKGCHNPESHDFSGGYTQCVHEIYEAVLQNPLLSGVTFSGGEPFCQARALLPLAQALQLKNIPILIYTGYTLEQLQHMGKDNADIAKLLHHAHMLIDGPFMQKLYDPDLLFRGSSNQRIWQQKNQEWTLQT